MDAAETFRYLLTNRTIPDKGIHVSAYEFVFQTVFYKCGPSYCFCRCAYDHEFLSYISDNGDVDVGILDTLTTAIKHGSCQHASRVTDELYLRETGINIYHIAAALDLEEMSRTSGYRSGEIYSKLFEIHPIHISVLKGNALVAPVIAKHGFGGWKWANEMLYAHEGQRNVIHVEKASLLELCIAKRDLEMVDLLFKRLCPAPYTFSTRERIYELLFKQNLPDILDAILDGIVAHQGKRVGFNSMNIMFPEEVFDDVVSIVKLAVLYDQRGLFDKSLQLVLMEWLSVDRNPLLTVRNAGTHALIMVCEAFSRDDNHKRILQWERQNLKEDRSTKNATNFVYLYGLLTTYTYCYI